MTPSSTYRCLLDIDEQTLSAWRDGLLGAGEAQRLDAHVAGCRACQSRLDEFDRLASTLRRQREAYLRPHVWRGLLARIESSLRRRFGRRGPVVWGGVLSAVAALLLVALFAALLSQHLARASVPTSGAGTPTGAVVTTTTARVSPTATQPAAQGWVTAQGMQQGVIPDVVFAPSAPATGYACIGISGANGAASIVVYGTQDTGVTWHELNRLAGGTRCLLSVNPTNPRDVVIVAFPDSPATVVFRSQDGGGRWDRPNLGQLSFQALGWDDGNFFITTQLTDSGSNLTEMFESVAGGAFVELDNQGKVGNLTLGQITAITGHGATIYLQSRQLATEPVSVQMWKSTDGGKTWAEVAFHDGSQLIRLLTASPDGRTLVGLYDSTHSQLAISRDDGASWQKLAAAPSRVTLWQTAFLAPDGSVVAYSARLGMVDQPDANIYELQSGASQWLVVATAPDNAFPKAVSWDAQGHVSVVWASQSLDSQGSLWQLIRHLL